MAVHVSRGGRDQGDEPLPADRPLDEARADRPRRDPLLLGAGVRPEAGRRAGDRHDGRSITPTKIGELPPHLHRALRPRPRAHAHAGDRAVAGRLRPLGADSSARAAAVPAPAARSTPRGSSPRTARAATRSRRPARTAWSARFSTTSRSPRRASSSRSATAAAGCPRSRSQLSADEIEALVQYLTGSNGVSETTTSQSHAPHATRRTSRLAGATGCWPRAGRAPSG